MSAFRSGRAIYERDLPFLDEIVPAPIRSKDAPSWPLVVATLKREAIILPVDGGEVVQSWADGMIPPAQRQKVTNCS